MSSVKVTIDLRRTTEGFYDTALIEASESGLPKLYQGEPALTKMEGVPEGPQRKNHVVR